jgi:thiol-disulfide isomerase/thioredoxin
VYSLVIGQAKWKFQPKRILEDGMLSKADVWRITGVGLALLAGSFMTAGQEVGGLQPGAKAPSFTLQDQTGKTQNLSSLTGPKGLVLLFFRSADWCPFCKGQLVDLER